MVRLYSERQQMVCFLTDSQHCPGAFAGGLVKRSDLSRFQTSCNYGRSDQAAEPACELAILALAMVIDGKPNLMIYALNTARSTTNRRDTPTLPEIANLAILDPQRHLDGFVQ
jgi:hypothetical protein